MYGLEIREKVIELIDQGQSVKSISDFLDINVRTIQFWIKKHKEGLSLSPNNHVPRQRKIKKDELLEYVQANPDKTLKEMGAVFKVHYSAIHRSLKRMFITLKKKSPNIRKEMSKREKHL